MRILLVHNYYRIRGGEDVVVEQELDLLRQSGVDAQLYAVRNTDIRGHGAEIVTGLTAIYNPWSRREFARELAGFKPDIVHVHNFFPRLSPSIFDACRHTGTPTVLTLHNLRIIAPQTIDSIDIPTPATMRDPPWKMIARKGYRGSFAATLALLSMVEFHKWRGTWTTMVDRFIALSSAAKTLLIAGGLPADRIVVKPNSVPRPTNTVRSEARDGALFVGRLDEQKGIRTLLEAWAGIKYPLTVIGEGPLTDLVRNCGNAWVTFLGRQPRDAVQQAMRASQFLVFPSLSHEMFPMTIAEAFANQLPVIASALPSLDQLVVENETGLMFPPGNAVALARRVTWALENQSALDLLGHRAYREYLDKYTPEANAAALIRLYRSLAVSRSDKGRLDDVGRQASIERAPGA